MNVVIVEMITLPTARIEIEFCSRRAPGEFTGSRNADDDFGGEDDEYVLILEHLQSIDSSTSTSREVSDDNVQKPQVSIFHHIQVWLLKI